MTFIEWETLSRTFVNIVLATVVRSLILATLCACLVWLLRSKTAELRWMLWRWMLLALLALPFLLQVTPPIHRASNAISNFEAAVRTSPSEPTQRVDSPIQTLVSTQNPNRHFSWILVVPGIYLLVALLLLTRLTMNLHFLRDLASRSQLIRDLPFQELAQEIWLSSEAFYKPRVCVSKGVTAPVTFYADDTWILLPPHWPEWSESKLRAVLTHEMAHIRRDDSAHLQLASFTACIFWFHPLAWFLRRRLAALAEEACDEAVIAHESSPEQYANFLIDFAGDVKRGHGRLVAEAAAFVRKSSLQQRIERIFADHRSAHNRRRLFASLALLSFLPAIYLTAAARFEGAQDNPVFHEGNNIWPNYDPLSLTPEQVFEKESALRSNPEDLDTRMELLVHYGAKHDTRFTIHLLWLIRNHPEIRTLPMSAAYVFGLTPENAVYAEQVQNAWQEALAKHPDSPTVVSNAANFLQYLDPSRAIELFRKAQVLDSGAYEIFDQNIAWIYVYAEKQTIFPTVPVYGVFMNADTATRLRTEIENSNDPSLLAATGKLLLQFNAHPNALLSGEQDRRALQLIQRAIQIDPGNHKWTDALEWAQAEPERRRNRQTETSAVPMQTGVIGISPKIAEAALKTKTDPVYPTLAMQARIEGTVEFTAIIGPDGKIENLTLVRGHPLLVNAAKDAVLKYVYQPATVDGKAVRFQTQILVPFQMNQ